MILQGTQRLKVPKFIIKVSQLEIAYDNSYVLAVPDSEGLVKIIHMDQNNNIRQYRDVTSRHPFMMATADQVLIPDDRQHTIVVIELRQKCRR